MLKAPIAALCIAIFLAAPVMASAAEQGNLEQLKAKQNELTALEAKIEALKGKRDAAAGQADLAASQVARLTAELELAELELTQTLSTITSLKQDIISIDESITAAEIEEVKVRERLGEVIIALYQHEQTSIIDIVLSSNLSLSAVLAQQQAYHQLQESALELIVALREQQRTLAEQRGMLTERQHELDKLRAAQAWQQQQVAEQRRTRQQVVALKEEEQAALDNKIVEARQARQEIEQHIFTLKGSEKTIQLNDAFSAAKYAADKTGVRPSLLLAVLKVETNVGANIGSGTFPDDMHPGSREAFLRVTKKLGLDPHTTPISRRPASYAGWGGAIGPGQFLPDTWERIEGRVAALMGKPAPNPFELADALVGIGIMLADRGAASPSGEVEALARYLAGPNWMYHTWYSQRVLAVAAEYGKEGLS